MSLTQLGEQIALVEVGFLSRRLVGEFLQMSFHQIAAPVLSHFSHVLFFQGLLFVPSFFSGMCCESI